MVNQKVLVKHSLLIIPESTTLNKRIARPFNNYGPGLKITDGGRIPDLPMIFYITR